MDRRILHLDIDAFLASVEQLRDPSLYGRPVAVGTGVVASRSYEAKARGVATAMPLYEALRRCPDLVVRAGDARLCERYRQRVAETLRQFAPVVEVCSLDDFYADLTGVQLRVQQALCDATASDGERSLRPLCEDVRAAVRAATGLSVAQGVGSTRTVARLATTRAKPGGICEVPMGHELDFLAEFAVRDLPGIGPKTAEQLAQFGVATVRELRVVDRELLRQTFGARGDEIYWRCRGLDEAPVRDTPALQSISRETSFEPACDDALQQHGLVRAMLSYLVDRAAAELRKSQRTCRVVAVRVRHVDGHEGESRRTQREPTDRTDELSLRARTLLDELLARRVLVRLVGVTLQGLAPRSAAQLGLFDEEERARGKLFAAVDAVRERHGFGSLLVGGASALLGHVPHGKHGFRLRTPSLTK
jgi:DNA polymerase-4